MEYFQKKKNNGKVRVMFSNRRQSAPELEDTVGTSRFQCSAITRGCSPGFGSELRKEGRTEERPGEDGGAVLCGLAESGATVETRGAPGPSSNPGVRRRNAGSRRSGDEAHSSPAARRTCVSH